MRLEPLYVARFAYPEGWGMTLTGPHGSEGNYLFIAEGRAEGGVAGRLRGVNHPRSRVDGSALPDVQGVLETDDGAVILFDWRGFARPYPEGRRQIVVSGTHLSEDAALRARSTTPCASGRARSARPRGAARARWSGTGSSSSSRWPSWFGRASPSSARPGPDGVGC